MVDTESRGAIRRSLCVFSLGLWLLAAGCLVVARAQQFRFDSWTTDNGLPQNGVRRVVQARDGYLWFTTFDGLVRFDGVKFTVFNKNNTPELPGNRFTDLLEDKDGTLWASLEDGSVVSYREGIFHTFPPQFTGHVGDTNFLHCEGCPLLLQVGGVAYSWNGQQALAVPELTTPKESLYVGASGTRWMFNLNRVRQVANGRSTDYPVHLSLNPTVREIDIPISAQPYEDRRGALWIGDYTGVYRLANGQIKHFPSAGALPPQTALRAYAEDAEGGIWFASGPYAQKGIGLVYLRNGKFTVWGRDEGLSDEYVFTLTQDREGNLWIATNRGLNRLRRQIIQSLSAAEGLGNTEVYPLLRDTQGRIWVGTMRGLARYEEGRFSVLPDTESWPIQALSDDGRGRLWVGAVGGLYWYENGRLADVEKIYAGDLKILPDGRDWPTTNAIYTDQQGRTWVGTERGLYLFENNRVTKRYQTADGLAGDDVKDIHETPDGTLWVGTYGGLSRLRDGKFTNYTTNDGLVSNKVRSLYQTSDGALWIGTYDGGLSRLKDGRIFTFTTAQGLFNDGVFGLREDWRGNFWISCNKGIYQVSRAELEAVAEGRAGKINSVAYGKADGMLNNECNGGRQPSVIEVNGQFWFPTQDGVAVVDPYANTRNEIAPAVHLESALVERQPVAISPALTIAPGQSNLEIAYTGVSFVKSEQVKFKYRMEGQDDQWVDAGTRRTAYYSYLPPGQYVFYVLAANADGVWSTEAATLRVVVRAAFYQTRWFRGLLLLAVTGLGVAAYRYRVLRLQRQTIAQQEFSRRLIASQEAERQRIAAELHDGLGQNLLVIKNRTMLALLAENQNGAMGEQVREISDMVSSSIEEVRQIARNLRPYQLDRLGLTLALQSIATNLDEAPGLECLGDIENVDGLFTPEAEINLYRIVQECANNILKHAHASRASIVVEREDGFLEVTIRDNGQGFDTVAVQRGLGLDGLAERARILNAECVTTSTPNQGTTVRLRVPLPEVA